MHQDSIHHAVLYMYCSEADLQCVYMSRAADSQLSTI